MHRHAAAALAGPQQSRFFSAADSYSGGTSLFVLDATGALATVPPNTRIFCTIYRRNGAIA